MKPLSMETPIAQTKSSSCQFVSRDDEWDAMLDLEADIKTRCFPQIHPSNTLIINVSPDYSSAVSMYLAHALSKDGLMLDMLSVDVPYPGELAAPYQQKFKEFLDFHHLQYDYFILVEAAVITGTNYTWMVDLMEKHGIDRSHIITSALLQSAHSTFACDCVGSIFNARMVEFYYERYNKHWN